MGKERFRYFIAFYCILVPGLCIGAYKSNNPKLLFGTVPSTISLIYQYDMLYGNMQIRA